jgi:hypothetical protein
MIPYSMRSTNKQIGAQFGGRSIGPTGILRIENSDVGPDVEGEVTRLPRDHECHAAVVRRLATKNLRATGTQQSPHTETRALQKTRK